MAMPGGSDGTERSSASDSSSQPFNMASSRDNVQEFRGMSEEEIAVMKECQRESFWIRAMPMALGAMLGSGYMVKSGRWTAHPKLGPYPKMFAAGTVGFFMGKVMYVPICQQKVLEKIPNSNLAMQINKSRNRGRPEGSDLPLEAQLPFGKPPDKHQASDLPPQKTEPGLDDRFRPSINNEVKEKEEPQGKQTITYDELRRKNRQEYEDNLKKRVQDPKEGEVDESYKNSPFMPQKPWPTPDIKKDSRPEAQPAQTPGKRKRTNMWGDVIED